MMRLALLCAFVILAARTGFGDPRSEILSLTGNARTKLVWVRFPWCDSNYTPVQAYKSDNSLGNGGPFTQLLAFDTDEGRQRYLDQENGYHTVPRITRKDGSHVIWTDRGDSCSWIRDHAGAAPKRKLLQGGDYTVVYCRYDVAVDKEYIYTLSGDGKRLSMMPLKPDYTADVAARTVVYTATDKMKASLGISADGKYLGTEIPWPQTVIVNMLTGQRYSRKAPGAFGCEPNLAPDNSYRFFHLCDEHDTIRLWEPNLSETYAHFAINKGMPGAGTKYYDCCVPHWTNKTQFFTNSYPLLFGYEVNWDVIDIFKMSAAQVKADDPAKAGTFMLGKFSADFKSVEKYVNISGTDIRRRDVIGDAWIADAANDVERKSPSAMMSRQLSFTIRSGSVEATLPEGKPGSLVLISASGRVVSQTSGIGRIRCSLQGDVSAVILAEVTFSGGFRVSRILRMQ